MLQYLIVCNGIIAKLRTGQVLVVMQYHSDRKFVPIGGPKFVQFHGSCINGKFKPGLKFVLWHCATKILIAKFVFYLLIIIN